MGRLCRRCTAGLEGARARVRTCLLLRARAAAPRGAHQWPTLPPTTNLNPLQEGAFKKPGSQGAAAGGGPQARGWSLGPPAWLARSLAASHPGGGGPSASWPPVSCLPQVMGAILIFLPGWDEIVRLKDKLEGGPVFGGSRCAC